MCVFKAADIIKGIIADITNPTPIIKATIAAKPSPNWKFVIPNSREISMAFSKSSLCNFVLLIIIVTGNSEALIISISFLLKWIFSLLNNYLSILICFLTFMSSSAHTEQLALI